MIEKEELGIDNLIIYQDTDLYRFTSDSIVLSRFAKVKKNEVVADICAGSGIVGIHFFALNSRLCKSVDFFELQTPLYSLCTKSVTENGLNGKLFPHNVRLQDIDKSFDKKFSLVLCNPPYMKVNGGFSAETDSSKLAKAEFAVTFSEIAACAKRLLKFGGRFTFIHRVDRLAEIIYTLKGMNLEPKRLQLLSGTDNKTPYLFLMEAVYGGKEGIDVLETLVNDATSI